jgi:hypothetical protein
MMDITRCGLDIAKQVFQVHMVNERGGVRGRKTLARARTGVLRAVGGEAAAAFDGGTPRGPLEIRLTFWFESRPAMDLKVSTTRTMTFGRLCVIRRGWCCTA